QSQLRLQRDELAFAIEAPARGVVVVNEVAYPGWQAEVDGTPAPIYRANGLVRAVPVASGWHRITMRFAPADGIWPRRVALVTAVLVLLGLIALTLRRRKPSSAPP